MTSSTTCRAVSACVPDPPLARRAMTSRESRSRRTRRRLRSRSRLATAPVGGTLGLAGTFDDPAAMRLASLIAGLGILLVGIGALALVRPWGLRLPRWLVIVPALAGSAYAASHALTAYVTKPLHALGVVQLQFDGWATRDEAPQFAWDLLFYEPWFLGSACSSRSRSCTTTAAPAARRGPGGGSWRSPWRRRSF